ncbi:DUF1499 domain-containing protein [Geobacter sp. DSM 9736]|uniref:DUF1499 domain-containing protein n=1 Tax=Geobacter sp. DSM 9736 TaxID=1277350 RepID=UPI000B504C04|nr:DUF1499 domain-containing protein [Geobacter sp. DSM 9736]SNB44666.1 Protein of unknown function [Geobacter sp. DSM 9736]
MRGGNDQVRREQRAARTALAGLALAIVSLLTGISAGTGSRLGLWHFRTGFTILHWSVWLGVLSSIVAVAGAILCGKLRLLRGVVVSVAGLVLGAIVIAVPVKWRMKATSVPPIHDITTDVVRPPAFVAILPLREQASNPPEYGGLRVAEQQQRGYPDIKTLIVELSPDQAFQRALETARKMGWRIVATVPAEGRIEATDTTFWFGFIDDMVIRITPAGYRSLVDIRSVSRVGRSDAGTNADRIRQFLQKLKTG